MKMENEPVQMVMEGLLQSVIQDGMHVDMVCVFKKVLSGRIENINLNNA